MESQVRVARTGAALGICGCLVVALLPLAARGAESDPATGGQLTLRKSIGEREYKGKSVEGEDRRVAPGDSLWRILIQEKGLPGKRFSQYIVVIRGLNPRLPANGALRVGETIFIPLRPDEALDLPNAPVNANSTAVSRAGKGSTQDYQIKAGDHLYGILRERLGIADERQLAVYYALVKDLNPQKTNWDLLVEGETIRLPVLGNAAEARPPEIRASNETKSAATGNPIPHLETGSSTPVKPPAAVSQMKSLPPPQLPARENLALLARVVESLDNEVERSGEQVVAVTDGTIRLEKSDFPVVYNRKLNQKVILDADDKIPAAMRSKLSDRENMTTVLSLSQNESLQQAVNQLLSRLGYQPLPANQPVMIQQGGVAFEAKGDWALLGPEQSNKRQEIYVLNIGDKGDDVPDYLRTQLASSGVHLKRISLGAQSTEATPPPAAEAKTLPGQAKVWPRDKSDIVDAVLFAYGIPFGVSEVLPVELRQGLKVDVRCDRVFEDHGRRTVLFFHRVEPELKQALEENLKVNVVELDPALSSRELIGKLLGAVGERAAYEEHRFNAGVGSKPDKLVVSAWGFLLSKPALFVTDRKIPQGYERFFFEKGLNIVYFQ